MKHLFSILFLAFVSVSLHAQSYSAVAKMDSTNMLIGEQLTLQLVVEFPAKDTIVWPGLGDTLSKEIEIVKVGNIDTSYNQENITSKVMQQTITITSFDSGYFPIKPIPFQFTDTTIYTEPLLVQVNTVAIDTSKGIADIHEPYDVPFNLWGWIKKNKEYIAGGLLVAILAAALVWWFTRKKPEVKVVEKPKPKIDPDKLAIKRLKTLESQQLWQNGKAKRYYSELSEIIREYLEGRFHIPALENTTQEIITSISSANLDQQMVTDLKAALLLADMVKFAKEHPLPEENSKSIKFAYNLVKTTTTAKAATNE